MTARRKTRRQSVLPVIGGLLIASAILRVSTTGQAIAEAGAEVDQTPPLSVATQPAERMTGDNAALLAAMQAREARLRERELALQDRMQAMSIAEAKLEQQIAALTEAEEALRATLALADSAAESDLDRLTRVYENMKPKDAAALFEQMSPDFAAGFLGLMEPVAAAGIMTLMTPESAYSISAVLAGRNANVPTE